MRELRSRKTSERWHRLTQVCIGGVWRPKEEWREYYGISYDAVRDRMRKYGWDFVTAVSTPLVPRTKRRKGIAA